MALRGYEYSSSPIVSSVALLQQQQLATSLRVQSMPSKSSKRMLRRLQKKRSVAMGASKALLRNPYCPWKHR